MRQKCTRGLDTPDPCGCPDCLKPHHTPIEPRRSFRWIFRCEGVPEHLVRRVRSLPGHQIEVGLFWPESEATPPGPKMTATGRAGALGRYRGQAAIGLMDGHGTITQMFDVTFDGFEVLWFDLDYGSSEPSEPRIILSGCVVSPRLPTP